MKLLKSSDYIYVAQIAHSEIEKINYFDFEELRFAIESLGGQYDKTRDFTADKVYKKIKNQKTK